MSCSGSDNNSQSFSDTVFIIGGIGAIVVTSITGATLIFVLVAICQTHGDKAIDRANNQ